MSEDVRRRITSLIGTRIHVLLSFFPPISFPVSALLLSGPFIHVHNAFASPITPLPYMSSFCPDASAMLLVVDIVRTFFTWTNTITRSPL